MTPRQREIIRHALGLDRARQSYRNHYVTGPGTDDFGDCEALVAAGMMRCHEPSELSGGDFIYVVTAEGREAVDAERGKQ